MATPQGTRCTIVPFLFMYKTKCPVKYIFLKDKNKVTNPSLKRNEKKRKTTVKGAIFLWKAHRNLPNSQSRQGGVGWNSGYICYKDRLQR